MASPSPVVWFKAESLSGLANGAAVAGWPDSSGNGYNALQPVGGNQPTYKTNAVNGLPAVQFNSASSTYLSFTRPVSNDFTIIIVYQSGQGIGAGPNFWEGAGLVNGEMPGAQNDFGTCLNANGQVIGGTGNPDTSIHSGSGFNDGRSHVVTFERTRSTGALVLYVDGSQVATGTGGTQSLTAPAQLVMGAQQTLNNYLSGDIAEVQIYNSALSDSDRQTQETNLISKYMPSLTGGWHMKQASLMTQWASQVDTNDPLPEYPRPQMVRSNWLNLNGIWQFQPGITNTDPVPFGQTLSNLILVPFPMESAISGVMAHYDWSWYRRTFTVPAAWNGQRVMLNFVAVDWQAQVYINGQSVGMHQGGYDPFSYDITPYLVAGTNELIVQVFDDVNGADFPIGKQYLPALTSPQGMFYTPASGIWQTVWLEPVPATSIASLTLTPDVANSRLMLTVNTSGATNGITILASANDGTNTVGTVAGNPNAPLYLNLTNPQLWSPTSPFLYNLQVSLVQNGTNEDTVESYFGMRSIAVVTNGDYVEIRLNGHKIILAGLLDQGYWPDGIYTAPTDAALKWDIVQQKNFGFNMIRKHQKVEPDRWYYWADKLGMLVMQDMPARYNASGTNPIDTNYNAQFELELHRMVTTHYNHPCIGIWTDFNEGAGDYDTTGRIANTVKTWDPTRLVNYDSGNVSPPAGNLSDIHNYPYPSYPPPIMLARILGEFGVGHFGVSGHEWRNIADTSSYITSTNVLQNLYIYFADLTRSYMMTEGLEGSVYTQVTDVEDEQNGLWTYDRKVCKVDPNVLYAVNQGIINPSNHWYYTRIVDTSYRFNAGISGWKYTFASPVPNWNTVAYSDSMWSTGTGAFGDFGDRVHTLWSTNNTDIWLRKSFSFDSAQIPNNVKLMTYHTGDAQYYINGVLAFSETGNNQIYLMDEISPAAKNAIVPGGNNVLAIHCMVPVNQARYVDGGIYYVNTPGLSVGPIGYWPLDETSGTTAVDASGNGNNGTVNGATWSANGHVNGCLNFNGINNDVQIINAISNDFSIAFWVKTAQTGGAGQWWQGYGLVDGSVSGATNDFGTALCGGKLAFGVGNPDTTILSTNAINDGAWHQCVVTRVQATGLMNLYVDGILQTTGTGNTNSLNASARLFFGAIASGGGNFNGSLDEVKIYNRALIQSEVVNLYYNSAYPASAPTNLTAVAANGQVSLIWSPVLGATSYKLKRATTSGGPYTIIGGLTTTSYADTNTSYGAIYYYVVLSVNALGESANSSEVSATIPTAPSPVVWFKAESLLGLANGAAVAGWPDSSGNGYNAVQPVSSNQPTYKINAVNGLPAVQFNSANSTYLSFTRPVSNNFTINIVYQSDQGIGAGLNFWEGAGLVNGEMPGAQNDFGTCLNANGQVIAGTGNSDTSIHSGGGFNDGRPHVVTFERTESTGALALYVDGMQVATGTGGTQSLTAPAQLVMGAQQTLNNYLSGDIAEVQIYNSALSDSDRVARENELKCKYGLSGGGVPPSPSGLMAVPDGDEITLNWLPTAGADGYNLWRSTNGGGTYQLIASGLSATSYVDTNVEIGRTNWYEVASTDGCGASTNSVATGVFLPLPALDFSVSGSALNISWPGWASDWVLYSASNLTFPVIWNLTTNVVVNNNGAFNVNLLIGSGEQFFRLMSQK